MGPLPTPSPDHTLINKLQNAKDWFDPNRLRADFLPTGFRGHGVKARAVKGHEFGLDLSTQDRKALIAFLKTL